MKRPVSIAGLAIMSMAVLVGFVPTLWSILLLFVTTLFAGHMIKKHAEESYKGFLIMFGLFVAAFNFIAGGMIMFAFDLPYVDRLSGAFLNLMVGIVIITLIKLNEKNNQERD